MYVCIYAQMVRETCSRIDRRIDRQTDGQIYRYIDRLIDREIDNRYIIMDTYTAHTHKDKSNMSIIHIHVFVCSYKT